MVNTIETEMLQSEWENWLAEENQMCEHVKTMLSTECESARLELSTTKAGGLKTLQQWQRDYCDSCHREQEIVRVRRKGVVY